MTRHAAARDVPDLPLRAEALQLAVAPESDVPAGGDDLRGLRGEKLEAPRRGRPPAWSTQRLLLQLVARGEAVHLRIVDDVVFSYQ